MNPTTREGTPLSVLQKCEKQAADGSPPGIILVFLGQKALKVHLWLLSGEIDKSSAGYPPLGNEERPPIPRKGHSCRLDGCLPQNHALRHTPSLVDQGWPCEAL